MQRNLLRATLTLGTVLFCRTLQAHPAAMHIAAAIGPAPAVALQPSTPDVQQRLSYYLDLLGQLALDAPASNQKAILDQLEKYGRLQRSNPQPPSWHAFADDLAAFYSTLREQHDILPLTWESRRLALPRGFKPIALTASLPHPILAEVHNHGATPITLALRHHPIPAPGDPRRIGPIVIPPGETRALFAVLRASGKAKSVELEFAALGTTAENRVVRIPVNVNAAATLRGTLLDADTSRPFPGRVYVMGSDGNYRFGKAYADNTTVSEKQILGLLPPSRKFYHLPFFYSDGTFEVNVPAGKTTLTMERGFEHAVVTETVDLRSGEIRDVTLKSGRIVDMKAKNWISGDTHVHWVKNSWEINESIALLSVVQRAEDIRVINNLTLMQRRANMAFIAPSQFPMGAVPGHCDDNYHIQMAEEYRNENFYGHLCFLNLKYLILPISTGHGMAGPDTLDYPINRTAILDCRAQGGISIEAHGVGRSTGAINIVHGLTDSLDQIPPEQYYRLLDCGFRLPLSNGSDHPARVTGVARVYVKVGGPFSYQGWIDGIRARSTFTTSGPLLFLNVNGTDIGGELRVKKGDPIYISAQAISRYALGNVQIIADGKIVREVKSAGRDATLEMEMPAVESGWIVARCSPDNNYSAIAGANVAHTSAIYVTVDDKPIYRPASIRFWINLMRQHAGNVAQNARFANDAQRQEALGYINDGIEMYEAQLKAGESRR